MQYVVREHNPCFHPCHARSLVRWPSASSPDEMISLDMCMYMYYVRTTEFNHGVGPRLRHQREPGCGIHATQGPCHSLSLYPRVSDIALLLHTNISSCRRTVLSEEGKFKKLKYFLTYYLLHVSRRGMYLKYVQNVSSTFACD